MASNAFTNPSSGKIDQQRKILEELEKRKKHGALGSQQMPMSNQISNTNNSNNTGSISNNQIVESPHMLNTTQKAAMDMANKTSFGHFIPQDSSFGNLILPVIPRIPPPQ